MMEECSQNESPCSQSKTGKKLHMNSLSAECNDLFNKPVSFVFFLGVFC